LSPTLAKPVQLRASLLLKLGVTGNRFQQASSERRIDPLEQFEEDHADGVAFACQPVSA